MSHFYEDLYALYSQCFPQYLVTPETFHRQLCPEKARVFAEYDQGRLVGWALAQGNSIPMLCVDRACRRQGMGSRLLAAAEGYIRGAGNRQVTLGHGERYLLQGVPDESEAVRFFQSHGYAAQWTSINMELDLRSFSAEALTIPTVPEGLVFRMAGEGDADALSAAVKEAEPGWLPIFAPCREPVLLAVLAGRVVGFETLSPTGGYFLRQGEAVGAIGCVGVVPSARNQGIGLRMVAHGAQRLKDRGCTLVELRYTWLESWYGKLGFRTVAHQWMGGKVL